MKKVKILLVALVLVIMGLTAGCAQIFSDINVNTDLTGTWKAKIFTADPTMLKKEDIEKELKQRGIQNFTVSPTKGEIVVNDAGKKEIADGWEVTMPWENQSELKKIVGLTSQMTAGNTKQDMPVEPLSKSDADNADIVAVNFGKATDKVMLHIKGSFVKETVKGVIIDDKTVEFTAGQPITFKFIASPTFLGIGANKAMIGGGILVALGGGLFLYRRKKV